MHKVPLQSRRRRYQSYVQGFGLVELMVSISIMVLVTTIILTKHDSFNGATLLRGQAYEIALQARETQLLAISAAQSGSGFRGVYGLYFNTSIPGAYSVFRDNDDDYFYDANEKFGVQGLLDPRFEIDEIRLMEGTTVAERPGDISILFERPNFDARIFDGSNTEVADNVTGVEIDVRVRGSSGTGAGAVRTIEITKTGQISVKNAS